MDNIYILESDGFYKIGVSTDVDKRVKELQVGNPHKIECIFARWVPEAYDVEKELHSMFKEHVVSGEWFKLSADELDLLKDIIVSFMRLCNIGKEDKERVKNRFLFKNNQNE